MSLAAEFRDWMRETVTVEPAIGQDDYGATRYGAPQTRQAYVAGELRTVQAFDGAERVSRVQVYLAEPLEAGPDDRLTLPAGWVPASPPLLAIQRLRDDAGALVEVLLA